MTTRVRIRAEQAFITLKGPSNGLSRDEYEYPIPLRDAEEILGRYCRGRIICKTRHLVDHAGMTWGNRRFCGPARRHFRGRNRTACGKPPLELPPWLGAEVTDDKRFGNFALALIDGTPDSRWWLAEGLIPATQAACCCRYFGQLSCCEQAGSHLPTMKTCG